MRQTRNTRNDSAAIKVFAEKAEVKYGPAVA